jgi:hypothetical protein
MRITKANLIEHIKAGRVSLALNGMYLLKISEGCDRGIHHIPDARVNKLGGIVQIEQYDPSANPKARLLSIA